MNNRFLDKSWLSENSVSLYPFFKSNIYSEISKSIRLDLKKGYKIAPHPSDIFRAFKECTFTNLNTVILYTEPYQGVLKNEQFFADGLAFSCRDSLFCTESLHKIYEEVDRTVYANNGEHLTNTFDLKKWAMQGVLLLNCALTTIIGRPSEHLAIWENFIKYVIYVIRSQKPDVLFILIGEKASEFQYLLENQVPSIKLEDVKIAVTEKRNWKCEDVFNRINEYHKKNNIKITW